MVLGSGSQPHNSGPGCPPPGAALPPQLPVRGVWPTLTAPPSLPAAFSAPPPHGSLLPGPAPPAAAASGPACSPVCCSVWSPLSWAAAWSDHGWGPGWTWAQASVPSGSQPCWPLAGACKGRAVDCVLCSLHNESCFVLYLPPRPPSPPVPFSSSFPWTHPHSETLLYLVRQPRPLAPRWNVTGSLPPSPPQCAAGSC